MTTYREWLNSEPRTNNSTALSDYIASLIRTEGWKSEFKAATRDVDYGVREAVCALANSRGGEVFVGVAKDGSVEGTPVTEQRLNEVLRQGFADRRDWFETDLVNLTDILTVPFPSGDRWAYVAEVRGPDRPAFVFENGRYVMPKRSGSDTIGSLDSRYSIEWFTEWRRGDVLRGCYKELVQFSSQLSIHRALPEGLPEQLPFMTAACAGGDFYKLLKEEDRTAIVGKGSSPGAASLYYGVLTRANAALARRPVNQRSAPLRDLEGMANAYSNLDQDLVTKLAELARYIQSKGFALGTQ